MAKTSSKDTERQDQDTEKRDREPTVGDRVGELLTKVRSRRRRFSRVKNLLTKIDGRTPQAGDFETWMEVKKGLDGYELGIDSVDEMRTALVEELGSVVDQVAIKTRMKFMTKLEALADQEELEVEKVSENPLVLYLDPITFEIDFDEGTIEMLYGHEAIDMGAIGIDAGAVLQARSDALESMERRQMESSEFFDLLYRAYRTVLVSDGAEVGERVDLVDVLVPLSMLEVDRDRLRKQGPDAMAPFPRYQLAYQLAALRRDGMLEKNGLRLDLGAATGGSTRDKTNVLYIPVGATSGQYYGSLRFE